MGNEKDEADLVAELGDRLRRRRGLRRQSQKELGIKVGSSKSTISRIERGEGRPSVHLANKLDEEFESDYFKTTLRAIRTKVPIPIPLDGPRHNWQHLYPARYSGVIYTFVVPSPNNAGLDHELDIWWDPWRHRVLLPAVPLFGSVFWHTKGDDPKSIPLFIRVEPAAFLKFDRGPWT